MNVWNKVKYPLLIGLIVVISLLLRVLIQSWDRMTVLFILPILMSRDIFGSNWVLLDILIVFAAAGSLMLIPTEGRFCRTRRFLLRPLLAVLCIFLVSGPIIDDAQIKIRELERAQRQEKLDATYQEIRTFLGDADVGYAYNTGSHKLDKSFIEAFPELTLEFPALVDQRHTMIPYVTDSILIDYDTQRIGIVYFRYGDPEFYLYQLMPAKETPGLGVQSHTVLPAPGGTFVCYSYNTELHQYTDALSLTMSDGRIYTITGMSTEKDLLFLGLSGSTELLNYWNTEMEE